MIINQRQKMVIKIRILALLILFCIISCQTQQEKPVKANKESNTSKKEAIIKNEKGMANPLMLSDAGGADLGRLFNAYYRTGQMDKMISLLDSTTKQKFSKKELCELLVNLEFGYDMKLRGASVESSIQKLNYICIISQTKVVKQLRVSVQNDTARIIPKDLKSGLIFN